LLCIFVIPELRLVLSSAPGFCFNSSRYQVKANQPDEQGSMMREAQRDEIGHKEPILFSGQDNDQPSAYTTAYEAGGFNPFTGSG
jgi:hypothetical protein